MPLTEAQKKLPLALQNAILAKDKKKTPAKPKMPAKPKAPPRQNVKKYKK